MHARTQSWCWCRRCDDAVISGERAPYASDSLRRRCATTLQQTRHSNAHMRRSPICRYLAACSLVMHWRTLAYSIAHSIAYTHTLSIDTAHKREHVYSERIQIPCARELIAKLAQIIAPASRIFDTTTVCEHMFHTHARTHRLWDAGCCCRRMLLLRHRCGPISN